MSGSRDPKGAGQTLDQHTCRLKHLNDKVGMGAEMMRRPEEHKAAWEEQDHVRDIYVDSHIMSRKTHHQGNSRQ